MKLKANKKAPNFRLPSTGKTIFQLNKIKKNIILYFYPKDNTPGCTIESRDFSKLNNLITKNKACVIGISKDSIESHLKFKKKYKLKFDLLSDEKLSVIKKYGVWGKKSFMGMKFMGIRFMSIWVFPAAIMGTIVEFLFVGPLKGTNPFG